MRFRNALLHTLSFLFLTTSSAFAQSKFKAGLGYNLISNNTDNHYLESYFARSLHASYAFIRQEKFSLSLESATSLRSADGEYGRETGFITSLPVNAQYEFRKIALHAGAGPAYLYQRTLYYQEAHSISSPSLHLLTGVAWKSRPFFADAIYPEFTLRANYFKSFRGSKYDNGMLGFVIFLRGI